MYNKYIILLLSIIGSLRFARKVPFANVESTAFNIPLTTSEKDDNLCFHFIYAFPRTKLEHRYVHTLSACLLYFY